MSDTITIEKVVEGYADSLSLKIIAGEKGLKNELASSDVHRPGLVLAGFVGLFTYDRAQVLGNSEMLYLSGLSDEKRRMVLETVCQFDIPCLVITDDNEVLPIMADLAEQRGIPLLTTTYSTTKFSHLFSHYLDEVFAPETALHGSLVDVYGIGLLFIGQSGIGKSEIALDLVERGHRLVADDIVQVSRKLQGILVGTSGETLRDHMEIRGLGILNVRYLFGVRAFRLQKRVEVVVKLMEFDETQNYDRVGLDEEWASILDVEIPQVTVPIYPGKNITVIAEAIALNYQLKIQGYHTAEEFNRRLIEKIQGKDSAGALIRADVE
jgi:HPr kinase/phosphorylase